MFRCYFFLNAILYAGLAVWCTLKHVQTARASGYVELNKSGHSEYLVIYGGLQLGLAIFFVYLGLNDSLQRVGALFSLMLYGPIVVYRVATVLRYSPVSAVTLATGAFEIVLLIGAIIAVGKTND